LILRYETLYTIDAFARALPPRQRRRGSEDLAMALDLLRLVAAFGGVVLLVAFWYWLMDSIGTF
jgi:hypothetical protein